MCELEITFEVLSIKAEVGNIRKSSQLQHETIKEATLLHPAPHLFLLRLVFYLVCCHSLF